MRYRRAFIPGGSFFFTVVTERRRPLLASANAVEVLRMAMRTVRATRSFEVDAMVVLPDHLHCIWTLPPDDADFATRWRLVKTWFTNIVTRRWVRHRIAQGWRSGSKRCGSTGIGSTCCATKRISSGTWNTFTTTR